MISFQLARVPVQEPDRSDRWRAAVPTRRRDLQRCKLKFRNAELLKTDWNRRRVIPLGSRTSTAHRAAMWDLIDLLINLLSAGAWWRCCLCVIAAAILIAVIESTEMVKPVCHALAGIALAVGVTGGAFWERRAGRKR